MRHERSYYEIDCDSCGSHYETEEAEFTCKCGALIIIRHSSIKIPQKKRIVNNE